MQNLFADFTADAIRRLFQVQDAAQQTSFIGRLLGWAGGKKASGVFNSSNVLPQYTDPIGAAISPKISYEPLKFHSGGVVPVFSDETVAILRRNEEVNTKSDRRSIEHMADNNRQMMDLMSQCIETMKNAQSSQPIIINAVDSQSFVDLLNTHGDSLVEILRRQGGLNNRY